MRGARGSMILVCWVVGWVDTTRAARGESRPLSRSLAQAAAIEGTVASSDGVFVRSLLMLVERFKLCRYRLGVTNCWK